VAMPRVCVGFDLTRIVDDIDGRGFNQVYAIGGDVTRCEDW
jgi:hypothetical protein